MVVGTQNLNLAERSWTIDDMWRFSQFAFFGELALWGISLFRLAYAHDRWRSCPGQPAQAASIYIYIYAYTEHVQFVDVSKVGVQ